MTQRILPVMVLVTVLTTAGAARAQRLGLPPGFEDALRPDYSRRDIPVFVERLELNDEQQIILRGLFEDYDNALREGSDTLRASLGSPDSIDPDERDLQRAEQMEFRKQIAKLMEEARRGREAGERDPNFEAELRKKVEQLRASLLPGRSEEGGVATLQKTMDQLTAELETWTTQKAGLTTRFAENVKAILSEEQLGSWPALERQLTRQKSLGRGRLSGEKLDLLTVVRELGPDEATRAQLVPTLLEYEIALHEALVARNNFQQSTRARQARAARQQDHPTAEALVDEQMRLRIAVRDVNDRYTEIIAGQLAEPLRARFTELVHRRAYPTVFRPTRAGRVITAARRLRGLDPDTLASIEALEERYQEEVGRLNRALLPVLRDQEPIDERKRALRPWGQTSASEIARITAPPGREAFEERNQLGDRYLEELMALLSPEQREQLSRFRRGRGATVTTRPDGSR